VSDAFALESPIPSDPEDQKLITLARAAAARTGARQGASLRDTTGRAYAAASVELEHLQLSAIAVAVAMTVSSGAEGVEAVAVVGQAPSSDDLDVLRDLHGSDVMVWSADIQGKVLQVSQL
jgi:cytidine deaminase